MHQGTLGSMDSGTREFETEAEAREMWDKQLAAMTIMGYKVGFDELVPPGARFKDAVTLHEGVPYA